MNPSDMLPFAGMIFSLLLALVIGGFVLMYPVTRRLGQWLEMRIQAGRQGDLPASSELAELRRAVKSLEDEVSTLSERQRFVEGLLDSPERQPSIAGGSGGAES